MKGYGVTDGLLRGHSEVLAVQLDIINNVPGPNVLGVPYYLPRSLQVQKPVVEVRCLTTAVLSKKGAPAFANTTHLLLTLVDWKGDYVVEDLPLARLTYASLGPVVARRMRNLFWRGLRIDTQRSFVRSVGTVFTGNVYLEFVYAK